MTAAVSLAADSREYGSAAQRRDSAAEAERAAYVAWQEAYGAFEVARDECADLASRHQRERLAG